MKLTICDLYDLDHTLAADYLRSFTYPWEALGGIGELILALGAKLSSEEYEHTSENIWIARDATVFPTATILGPCIIGHETEVRPGAFIRGNALVGEHCVVGNSTELKNVILFDNVQVPHYNYVGQSSMKTSDLPQSCMAILSPASRARSASLLAKGLTSLR